MPMPDVTSPPLRASAAPAAAVPTVVIRPKPPWSLGLRELWRYRQLLYFLTWRDLKVRYKQTFLGVTWAVLQPVMYMVVFTLFFGNLAGISSNGLPYALFSLAGLAALVAAPGGIHLALGASPGTSSTVRCLEKWMSGTR